MFPRLLLALMALLAPLPALAQRPVVLRLQDAQMLDRLIGEGSFPGVTLNQIASVLRPLNASTLAWNVGGVCTITGSSQVL